MDGLFHGKSHRSKRRMVPWGTPIWQNGNLHVLFEDVQILWHAWCFCLSFFPSSTSGITLFQHTARWKHSIHSHTPSNSDHVKPKTSCQTLVGSGTTAHMGQHQQLYPDYHCTSQKTREGGEIHFRLICRLTIRFLCKALKQIQTVDIIRCGPGKTNNHPFSIQTCFLQTPCRVLEAWRRMKFHTSANGNRNRRSLHLMYLRFVLGRSLEIAWVWIDDWPIAQYIQVIFGG